MCFLWQANRPVNSWTVICVLWMRRVCEILQVNNAVRSTIRDNKNHQIDSAIASGSRDGMISMDQAIAKLYKEGRVSQEVALLYADKPEQLKRQL